MTKPKLVSKFSILPIFVCAVISLMAPFLLYMCATSPIAGMELPIFYCGFAFYFWLTEFRTRAHKISLNETSVSVRPYFGLGKEKIFRHKDIEGFISTQQPSRHGASYEYLFLLKDQKRIICISKYYHRNFPELKQSLQGKIPYLGQYEYGFFSEFREMFR